MSTPTHHPGALRREASCALALVREVADPELRTTLLNDVKSAPALIANAGLLPAYRYFQEREARASRSRLGSILTRILNGTCPCEALKSEFGSPGAELLERLAKADVMTLMRITRSVLEHLRWMRVFPDPS
jgi:CRISPR/Cas system CMR-associated protein Cmr5 small subunit